LWSSELRKTHNDFEKHIELKDQEIKILKRVVSDNEQNYEQKLVALKDRLKSTEKTIFEQVERDYADLIKEKDDMLDD